MNMINVRRLTVMTFLGASMLSGISAQVSPLQSRYAERNENPGSMGFAVMHRLCKGAEHYNSQKPDHCGQHEIDVKTAKAALFPSLSFSTSQQVVNRPYQETSSRVSGNEIIVATAKTATTAIMD